MRINGTIPFARQVLLKLESMNREYGPVRAVTLADNMKHNRKGLDQAETRKALRQLEAEGKVVVSRPVLKSTGKPAAFDHFEAVEELEARRMARINFLQGKISEMQRELQELMA